MRRRFLSAVAVAAFVLPTAAHAAPALIAITHSVHPGGSMSISVRTGIDHNQCTIRVHYRARPPLTVAGLAPRGTLFAGIVQWQWQMPKKATRGTWSVDVSCGSGTLHTSFVVR